MGCDSRLAISNGLIALGQGNIIGLGYGVDGEVDMEGLR